MWTAASGMKSLQLSVDNISHNLANVNTTGYKKGRTEFKDLLYVKLNNNQRVDDVGAPVGLEIGHGVIPGANVKSFAQGPFQRTDNKFDFGVEGDGFFEVENINGEKLYTRDGSFRIGLTEGGGKALVTTEGYFVQGSNGRIIFDGDITDISVDTDGHIEVKYAGATDDAMAELGTINLMKIPNPQGLYARGNNFYAASSSSGVPVLHDKTEGVKIRQGVLEMSNVQIVDEMVAMITAQRAYEINSKAIQTADQMLELANNLKR